MDVTPEVTIAIVGAISATVSVLGNVVLYFVSKERRKTLKVEASAETAVLREKINAMEAQADVRARDIINEISKDALDRERGLREELKSMEVRYQYDRGVWTTRLETLTKNAADADGKAQQSIEEAVGLKALVAAQNDTIDRLRDRVTKLESELTKAEIANAALESRKKQLEEMLEKEAETRRKEVDAAVSPLMDRIRLKRQIIQNQEGYIATLEAVLREHGIDYKKPSVLVETAPLKPTEPPEITSEPAPEASGESLVEVIGETPHEHNGNS